MARVSDLLIAVVLIAVTLPLMVVVALAIKLEAPASALKREQWDLKAVNFSCFVSVPKVMPCKGPTGSGLTRPSL